MKDDTEPVGYARSPEFLGGRERRQTREYVLFRHAQMQERSGKRDDQGITGQGGMKERK